MSTPELHLCVSTIIADPMSASADEIVAAVEHAAEAGFDGVSLWTLHHMVAASGGVDLASVVADAGLRTPVVEAMAGWANAADERAIRGDADFALAAAAAMGADTCVAVCLEPDLTDRARTVANLTLMASIAADAGVTVAIEFLPWTGISNIRDCAQLIADSGADNVGVLLDSWHWVRQPGGADLETLLDLDPSMVPLLQICDAGEPGPEQYGDAMTARLLPGDGHVDFDELFAALLQIGADPIVSPEIFNRANLAAGVSEWAESMERSCRQLVEGSGLGRST